MVCFEVCEWVGGVFEIGFYDGELCFVVGFFECEGEDG